MSQEQPFLWKSSLGGPVSWVGWSLLGSPGQVKHGQTVFESQIWHQPTGSVGGGFSKGTTDSSCPDARHFISPCMLLMPFKLPPRCWSSEGVSLIR